MLPLQRFWPGEQSPVQAPLEQRFGQAGRLCQRALRSHSWGMRAEQRLAPLLQGMHAPSPARSRDRVLNDDEIRCVWQTLPTTLPKSISAQRILKLCLITGQRVGEAAGMRRDELDFERRVWSLPGSRTKNGFAHSVPLSSLAISIIE